MTHTTSGPPVIWRAQKWSQSSGKVCSRKYIKRRAYRFVKLLFEGVHVENLPKGEGLNRKLTQGKHEKHFRPLTILGDPGAVIRVGRKGGTKVFITGERAPGYRLSPDHFQKFKRMPAPDWAQKMLCIIVPNRRTHLNEFFSCVRKWRLLSRSRLV